MKKITALLLVILISVATMAICCKNTKAPKYKIDYSGQKFFFTDVNENEAKEEYKAGERVLLFYRFIATDTNYYFYMDGADYNPGWDDKQRAFVIDFIMPEHDVTLQVEQKNTMIYDPSEDNKQ